MSDEKSNVGASIEKKPPTREISALERREIQAPIMVSLIGGFIRELGYEKAMLLYLKSADMPGVFLTNKIRREYRTLEFNNTKFGHLFILKSLSSVKR